MYVCIEVCGGISLSIFQSQNVYTQFPCSKRLRGWEDTGGGGGAKQFNIFKHEFGTRFFRLISKSHIIK